MFRMPIPPARPGGVALACGRHLPRQAGRPPHGPAGPALPPVVHHRRPPPLRGVSRSFPPPGRRRLTPTVNRQGAKHPKWQSGNLATRNPRLPNCQVAWLPDDGGVLGELGGSSWVETKNPRDRKVAGAQEENGRGSLVVGLSVTPWYSRCPESSSPFRGGREKGAIHPSI